jgi:tetratricopeptide (TPR) repeat protein
VRQIGRELGVRYVLEGSVQRGGNRVRVNVQLINAETGNHLWAERFDKPLADLFDMQDEIVARLAGQLGTALVEAEARRAERSSNPDSMDFCFRGIACIYKGWSPDNLAQAHSFFERSLALDADNIVALVVQGFVDNIEGSGLAADKAHLAAAEAAATKALSVAPNYALAHSLLAGVYINTNRAAQGIAALEHALALDRNLAGAHASIGVAKIRLGRTEETEGHILEALRLSPRDIAASFWMSMAGAAKCYLGHDEEAVAWLRQSIEANRNYPLAHFILAAALAHLGKLNEARAAAQTGLGLDPNFTISRARAVTLSDNPTYLAQRERAYHGMRMAGVPD